MKNHHEDRSIQIFDSADAVAESIAQQWMDLSLNNTRVDISLSGGSTPKHVFGFIAHSDFSKTICWQNLHFWWGDERCVSAKDEESNYGEAMRLLFSHVLIPADNLHPIHGELTPEKACIEFKDEMDACLSKSVIDTRERPVYDWVILGVGDDGHTASLFPCETDYEAEQNAIVALHPASKQPRVTLTAPVISAAKRVTYLALGEGKKQVLADILNNYLSAEHFPAANIASENQGSEWYLDKSSASGLSE